MKTAHRLLACTAALVACVTAMASLPDGESMDSFGEWKAQIDETLEDLRLTSRLQDRLAMLRELAEHIQEPVEPRARYIRELRSLLGVAPAGILLNTVVHSLVAEKSPKALEALLGVLGRQDFKTLDGRPLATGAIEMRHRIVEANIMFLGDRVFERRVLKKPVEDGILELGEAQKKTLERGLASENERRIRSAAYVLGGTGQTSSAPKILAALRNVTDSWTRAVLIEALGRTDPQVGRAEVLQAATDGKGSEKLAAIPILGFLKGDDVDAQLRGAFDSRAWQVRRAAVEACRNRRDTLAATLLFERFPEETARLQRDIYTALLDLTGGILPPDPKEWQRWWKLARNDFRAAPRGESDATDRKTQIIVGHQYEYFGMELWSSQVAIVFDISSSMASTNIRLGLSGVGVEGRSKTGSPFVLAKDQITRLLKKFQKKTRFNLIAYSDKVKGLGKRIVPASRSNLGKAMRFVKKVKASGDTNTFGALAMALTDPEVDTIFLLSDGEPTRGLRTEPTDILEAVARYNRFRQTRINTIQLGPDLEFMRLLAKYSDGRYRNIRTKPTKDSRPPKP